jgi:hypothetical protein
MPHYVARPGKCAAVTALPGRKSEIFILAEIARWKGKHLTRFARVSSASRTALIKYRCNKDYQNIWIVI